MSTTRITDKTIALVRQASPIIEVIQGYGYELEDGPVPGTFVGPCFGSFSPDTQTAFSFSVNPTLGMWGCEHCGEGGDVFSWVLKHDQVTTFDEAVELLAERAGTLLTREAVPTP